MQNAECRMQKSHCSLLHFAFCILTLALILACTFEPGVTQAQSIPPNDPLFEQQWGLERIGAPCAWPITTGHQGVIVAVVDSGADMGHPDLAQRLRQDGFDFVDNDGEPWDENGHGTHVAGIIAASIDNAEGIAGMAPGVQILPVRVMNAEGVGSDRTIAAGITYAVDRGARVINLSLGATLLLATPESSPQAIRAIRNALAADIVVVVAAGNDFVPLPNAIVGENTDVLVVAASDREDQKAGFSNSGPWVDITAPGERIVSTMPTYEVYLTSSALPAAERFQQRYDSMSGTSQAAPFVTAVAALLLSAHPDWSAAEVRDAITTNAIDIYDNHPSYYRRLRLLGSGLLDACGALGTPREQVGPLAALLSNSGLLLLSAGAVGACALALTILGAGLALARRPRRPPPQVAPPPAQRPAPAGDTLPASQVAWGVLRVVAGPAAPAAFALSGPEVTVGRHTSCAVRLSGDAMISRQHARLSLRQGGIWLEDLGSSHGTRLGGRAVGGPVAISPGDTFVVGQTTLRLEQP
jgi:thermitase